MENTISIFEIFKVITLETFLCFLLPVLYIYQSAHVDHWCHFLGGAASGGRLNGSLINLYANCDGAFDTSSSEEDGKSLKIKQAKKNVRSTPYPPLKIITSSQASGSSQNNTKGNLLIFNFG